MLQIRSCLVQMGLPMMVVPIESAARLKPTHSFISVPGADHYNINSFDENSMQWQLIKSFVASTLSTVPRPPEDFFSVFGNPGLVHCWPILSFHLPRLSTRQSILYSFRCEAILLKLKIYLRRPSDMLGRPLQKLQRFYLWGKGYAILGYINRYMYCVLPRVVSHFWIEWKSFS